MSEPTGGDGVHDGAVVLLRRWRESSVCRAEAP